MISATIITIGDELLIGQTIDTNSAWIAQEFNKIGIKIKRRVAIADEESEILHALKEASENSDIVITTGGLGPTNDDITKETLCKYFNTSLVQDNKTLQHISDFFAKRGRELLQVNIDQALVPENATVLFNAVGTAPGIKIEREGKFYFSLPGVPFEMKHLITERILPDLKEAFQNETVVHKTLVTSGMGESFIAEQLKDYEANLSDKVSMAYLPNFGMVKIRLSGIGKFEEHINTAFAELEEKLQDIIISTTDRTLEQIVFDALQSTNKTIAIAESCTGGNVASKLVGISGASAIFNGSTVTYATESKHNILNVGLETLKEHTAVSKQTALEMATNARTLFKSDYGLATTGYLEGEEPHFYVAISSEKNTIAKKFNLPYNRKLNSKLAVSVALQFLIRFLKKYPK